MCSASRLLCFTYNDTMIQIQIQTRIQIQIKMIRDWGNRYRRTVVKHVLGLRSSLFYAVLSLYPHRHWGLNFTRHRNTIMFPSTYQLSDLYLPSSIMLCSFNSHCFLSIMLDDQLLWSLLNHMLILNITWLVIVYVSSCSNQFGLRLQHYFVSPQLPSTWQSWFIP